MIAITIAMLAIALLVQARWNAIAQRRLNDLEATTKINYPALAKRRDRMRADIEHFRELQERLSSKASDAT